MQFDDSDMKIVGEPVTHRTTPLPAQELQQQQKNGNLDKAKALGASLIPRVMATGTGVRFPEQRQILRCFAAVVGLESFLPAGVPAEAARNAFYDALLATGFYETLRASGAFSFYYLCLREGAHVEYQIGITFAQLCGEPKEPALIAEGSEIYSQLLEQVRVAAEAKQFV